MTHTVPAHLGGHGDITHSDEGVLDYLIDRFQIRSMIDVGCGPGEMLDIATMKGLVAVGVDGDINVATMNRRICLHDYTMGPFSLWQVDLVWSVEFVEHVEERYIENFLTTFRSGRVLMMSHAIPGQGGHHHVNEQSSLYWVNVLSRDGWALDDVATEWVRSNASDFFIRQTGMVFTK